MTPRTDKPRFFFLNPRLLKQMEPVGEHHSRAVCATQPVVGKSGATDCSLSHDAAEPEIRKTIEH